MIEENATPAMPRDSNLKGLAKRLVRLFWSPLEILEELKSINRKLSKLEGCVRSGAGHRRHAPHIVTGHWND